jgi:hypothetical protein
MAEKRINACESEKSGRIMEKKIVNTTGLIVSGSGDAINNSMNSAINVK